MDVGGLKTLTPYPFSTSGEKSVTEEGRLVNVALN